MSNTVNIAPRKDFVKSDGTSPINLILTINRKRRHFSIGKSIALQFWDITKGEAIKTFPDREDFNLLLKSKLKRAQDILYQYELHHKQLTFDLFESEFFHPVSESFYEFVESELKSDKNKSINRDTTAKGYSNEVSKMKQFRKEITFKDITVPYLSSYEGYMRNDLKNKQNTMTNQSYYSIN